MVGFRRLMRSCRAGGSCCGGFVHRKRPFHFRETTARWKWNIRVYDGEGTDTWVTRSFLTRLQRTKQVVITPMRNVKSSKTPRHYDVFAE